MNTTIIGSLLVGSLMSSSNPRRYIDINISSGRQGHFTYCLYYNGKVLNIFFFFEKLGGEIKSALLDRNDSGKL